MRRLLAVAFLAGMAAASNAAVSVRVLLGVGDTAETRWDGEVVARGARITSLDPWRFDGNDAMLPGNRWRMGTHPIRLFGGILAVPRPVVANGVVVHLEGESETSEVELRTKQGNFSVRLGEIPFGRNLRALGGRALAERVPATIRITNGPDEQDYPAVATDSAGAVWLAYLEFKHHPDHNRIRTTPNQFDNMTARPGGDQILLRRYEKGAWGETIAITPPGGDLYRPGVAVDGRGRPWVFWSAQENGNFDLWARAVENGEPRAPLRLTSAAGTDMDPVATTDAGGRVWVAWQGWRDGRAAIFAAAQNGETFLSPSTVSASAGNEWNPAIAADGSGRVTVAWDSYRNGQYDVYFRTATGPGAWSAERPAAATTTYEAYPSIAYDRVGTLWVAYEEGATRWGKDFGADESSGVALYAGRAIRLRGFTKEGQAVETALDVGTVLPGVPAQTVELANRQSETDGWLVPDTEAWKNRGLSAATQSMPRSRLAPRNTLPRLLVDSSGRLWLACRSMHPIFWTTLGTIWTEHLVSYNGGEWTGGIYLHHTDNLLDNRPALASVLAGELLVIGSSDGRRQFREVAYAGAAVTAATDKSTLQDPYQNDLWMSRVTLPPAVAAPAVRPAVASAVAGLDPRDKAEQSTIAVMRNYRLKTAGGTLRVLRGEFHRHSEFSQDGGNDGTILDQYRYMIDASYMDWVGCCDHDNGLGREYMWWLSQKLTDLFHSAGKFTTMFSYERSVTYPEGHRNVVFAKRGIRPLPRLPRTDETPVVKAPDTLMLYAYLKKFNGVVASHTSATNMGTDWRDNDPDAEPVVEIYQGDRQNYEMLGAPRSSSEKDAIGGWRPKGFVNLALEMGYKLAFEASSDHLSTHMSYSNILARDATREALLEALQKRHVYGATDHILAEFRSGDHIMGDAFSTSAAPSFQVKLTGTAPFARVQIVKNNRYVYSTSPNRAAVSFTWRDMSPEPGKTSYYYVRGEQADGELVWVSPMWVTFTSK